MLETTSIKPYGFLDSGKTTALVTVDVECVMMPRDMDCIAVKKSMEKQTFADFTIRLYRLN